MTLLTILLSLVLGFGDQQPQDQAPPEQPNQSESTQDQQNQDQPEIAPDATPAANAPTAEEIFARYVEAIGGREKMKEIKSRRVDGRYSGPPFSNFPARLTLWQEYPNKFDLKIQQPAGATIELAYDGERGWEQQPGVGYRMLQGIRLLELKDTADFWGEASWKDRYVELKTIGEFANFAGEKAWVVHVKTKDGREKLLAFSEETGLFLGTRTLTMHPKTGKPERFETILKDYKEYHGVKFPTGMTQHFYGQKEGVDMDFLKVEINSEEAHDFSPPAELQKTLDATGG